MTILIVENEAFVLEDIRDMLNQLGYRKLYDTDTVDGALKKIKCFSPDIVLVDIDLNGDKDGVDLGKELDEKRIPFIYLSDLQDLKTFERAKATHPQTNLAKPVNQLQLRNALLEVKTNPKPSENISSIWVSDIDKKFKINKADIIYLKAAGNNCYIYLDKNKGYKKNRFISSTPMARVLDTLGSSNIVRVHKSYCINIDKVENFWGNQIILKGKVDPILMTDTFKSNFINKVNLV